MHVKLVTLVGLFAGVIWAPEVHAYIDPGTGSILVQGLIAAIAAVGVTLKLYWHKFVGIFSRSSKDDDDAQPSGGEPVAESKKE